MAAMTYKAWQDLELFQSSSFRDMNAERDAMQMITDTLAARCKELARHLRSIDLRWGVESEDLRAELKAENPNLSEVEIGTQLAIEIVGYCVRFFSAGRPAPVLVVFLGDRYGWIPNQAIVRQAAAENPDFEFLELEDRSVTQIELEVAALNKIPEQTRAVFFFRQLAPQDIPAHRLAEYWTDPKSSAGEKLTQLKDRIRELYPDRCWDYQCGWDAARDMPALPADFSTTVTEKVWQQLSRAAVSAARPPQTWQEEEASVQSAFVAERGVHFQGRQELLDEILGFLLAKADATCNAQVWTGEPGAGKSSLFAKLVIELQQQSGRQGPLLLDHAFGVSPRGGNPMDVLRRWCQRLARTLGESADTVHDATTDEDLRQ